MHKLIAIVRQALESSSFRSRNHYVDDLLDTLPLPIDANMRGEAVRAAHQFELYESKSHRSRDRGSKTLN